MPPEGTRSSQRRKFKVQSQFGDARKWRSRKNRPCDACRKRKTVCIITTAPPCLFCKGRGLNCTSAAPSGVISESGASSAISANAPHDETSECPEAELLALGSNENAVSTFGEVGDDTSIHGSHSQSYDSLHDGIGFVNKEASQRYAIENTPEVILASPITRSRVSQPIESETRTLEDNENKTAHSMGPAAEQDTHFLASFRSDILSGPNDIDAEFIQVYAGGKYPWDPPVHFCLIQDEFAHHDNDVKEAASRAIEELIGPYGRILVRLYFKHIHPVLPILSKVRFLRQYSEEKTKIPASLRGAVYSLASVFWKNDPSIKGPFPFQQHELADLATDSLQRELDSPNLYKLQASLLLLHVKPNKIDSIAHPKTWTSTAQAVACAQMIGLHQDAERWNIPTWEKRLRRKLWWATFVTDVWSAVCHGNPPHIYPASYNTSEITMDDIRGDEIVPEDLQNLVDTSNIEFHVSTGARFLELVRISQTLRELFSNSLQVPRLVPPESQDEEGILRTSLVGLHAKLQGWNALLPQCLAVLPQGRPNGPSNNAPLHLAYYSYLALLYRALMSPATRVAKATPTSRLRQWFGIALVEFKSFTKFMTNITAEDLQGFWGRHARSQMILCGNFLIYLFLLASDPADVTLAFQLIESLQESLQRLARQADSTSELLILPVSLRIDSFFTQAADRLRAESSSHAEVATTASPEQYSQLP